MAKSNFLTDKFSTTGGLAAVAYGSSSFFPTVADQIKRGSKTKALDSQLPSHAFLDFVGTRNFILDVFKTAVQEEYDAGEIITDFIDLYATNVDTFSDALVGTFISTINRYSTYSVTLTIALKDSIEKTSFKFSENTELQIDSEYLAERLGSKFIEAGYIGEDAAKLFVFLANNPNTKVSAAPPDNLISLNVQGVSTRDARGVERNYGTLPPQDYYAGIAYKSEGSAFKKAVVQGYVGYPLVSLLGESILNPDTYEELDLDYIGSSVLNSIQDNSLLSDREKAIYNINLAIINFGTN